MPTEPMELLFRKYFWAVQLACIATAALLAAKIVNLFVEGAILPSTSAPVASVRASAPVQLPAFLDAEKLARLTGLVLPVETADTTKTDLSSDPVRTSMRAKLLGTLRAGKAEMSLASVLDLGAQRSMTVMVGDRLLTSEVLDILRDRVIVLNNGRREYVSADTGDGAPTLPTVTKVTEPGGGWGAGVKALDATNYEVPRSELDRAINNLNDVAMQARLVPAFKDGVSEGFKLFSIRPDSLYSKIGIQNGDVVTRINGLDMNDPAKALEVYTKLKDAPRIDVDIDRNGTVMRMTYNIR